MNKVLVIFITKKFALIFLLIIFALLIASLFLNFYFEMQPVNQFIDPNSGIIVIDPGHGGIDGGTNKEGILEKEINLDISKKLKYLLQQKGFTVIMTRESDVSLETPDNSNKSRHMRDLKARTSIINNSNAQLFLSIHVNCNFKKPSTDGAIVFYNERFEQSKALAFNIQGTLNTMTVNGKKRTVHQPVKAKYFVLDRSTIPGVLIETAFMSNNAERHELVKDTFKEEISKCILQGIEDYLKEARRVSSPAIP